MILRVSVRNTLSFGDRKEFNLFPAPKKKLLKHHKYQLGDFEYLKLSAIYGANGAGKSNLIKIVDFLVSMVNDEYASEEFLRSRNKFSEKSAPSSIGIEFLCDAKAFFYEVVIENAKLKRETLCRSFLGDKDDVLLFDRSTDGDKTQILFGESFAKSGESRATSKVLESIIKPGQPLLPMLGELDYPELEEVKVAEEWFHSDIQVIHPFTRPKFLALMIEENPEFGEFARELICAYNTGIKDIRVEKIGLQEYFGKDDQETVDMIFSRLDENPDSMILVGKGGGEITILLEDGVPFVKRLVFIHEGDTDESQPFYMDDESDGTVRLLDYVPLFYSIIHEEKVYLVDEIERSIHPTLIYELLKRFSSQQNSKGQLIFTTHESNLLDTEIFRPDEVWFVEKDTNGNTDLYPLSDFKEHHTANIRKRYLAGRYGAIPFIGELDDLKWNSEVLQ